MKSGSFSNPWRIAAGVLMFLLAAQTVPAQTVPTPEADLSELVFDTPSDTQPKAAVPEPEPVKEAPKTEVWDATPLRDPFWPVGYFPEGWQKNRSAGDSADAEASGWKAASAKIRIDGTSTMGGKAAAIVNGKLKVAGELVEVTHGGRVYQWKITAIDADGQIHLKKDSVR